jgi:TolB-like protein
MLRQTETLRLLLKLIEASEERCVAAQHSARQARDLVTVSREAIARSKDQIARLTLERPRPRYRH